MKNFKSLISNINKYLFILLMGSVLSACNARTGGDPMPAAVFGDSISQGSDFGNGHLEGYAWSVAKDLNWSLDNQAVGGTRIYQQIEKIKAANLRQYENILFLSGYNDMRFYGMDPQGLAQFKDYFCEAVQLFAASGARVFIGNTLRMNQAQYGNWAPYNKGSDQAARAFSQVITDCMNEFGTSNMTIVDVNSQYNPVPEILQDGVHPNQDGIKVLTGIFERAIEASNY